MADRQFYRIRSVAAVVILVLLAPGTLAQPTVTDGPTGIEWINSIDAEWGIDQTKQTTSTANGFPVPLGAMEKVRGSWRHKQTEAVSGQLLRTTWSVKSAPVTEVFDRWRDQLANEAELVFSCVARACGNGSQWANRVYGERLLYGRVEFMRYAAFRLPSGEWLTLFTAARTPDRQYLHVDLITPSQ